MLVLLLERCHRWLAGRAMRPRVHIRHELRAGVLERGRRARRSESSVRNGARPQRSSRSAPRSRTRDRPSPSSCCRSTHTSARHPRHAACDPSRSLRWAASCRATAPPPETGSRQATRTTPPRAPRRPRARRRSPTTAQPRLRDPRPRPASMPVPPPPLGLSDRPARRPIRPRIPHRHQHPMHHISPHQRARPIHQFIDLGRERVDQRPLTRPFRQPAPRHVTRGKPTSPPSRDRTPPAPPLPATTPSRQTPQGSPSLPRLASPPGLPGSR